MWDEQSATQKVQIIEVIRLIVQAVLIEPLNSEWWKRLWTWGAEVAILIYCSWAPCTLELCGSEMFVSLVLSVPLCLVYLVGKHRCTINIPVEHCPGHEWIFCNCFGCDESLHKFLCVCWKTYELVRAELRMRENQRVSKQTNLSVRQKMARSSPERSWTSHWPPLSRCPPQTTATWQS